MEEPLGDIDFYPNGGHHQPGCNKLCPIPPFCLNFDLWDLFNESCSHSRAIQYYVESIQAARRINIFISKLCKSWSDYQANNCEEEYGHVSMGEGLQQTKLYVSLIQNKKILTKILDIHSFFNKLF